MSSMLYRIGRACYRHGVRVLAVWLVVLGALGGDLPLPVQQHAEPGRGGKTRCGKTCRASRTCGGGATRSRSAGPQARAQSPGEENAC